MKKITYLFLMCFTSISLFAQTFTGGTGPITDNNCDATHDFPVTVSGVGVLGVTNSFSSVGFSITHTFDGDLVISLVAPDGTIVLLSNGNGGSGTDYTNTVFSANGATSITAGTAPFTGTYTPEGNLGLLNAVNADGTWILRVCDVASGDTGTVDSWSITFAPTIFDLPDYVNLQYPGSATFQVGGNVTVYGQVYEGGLTDVAPNIVGQAPGINAWIGISPLGADTNPNTWTNWVAATWNSGAVGNNDEYQAAIGATLAPGTYYYATRFQLNGGAFVYGGYSPPPGGGVWDGTTYVSGVLTVTPPPAVTPNCDLVGTLADPSLGGSTWDRPLASGTGLSGVGVGISYHIYGPFTVDTGGSYTFTSTQDFDGYIFVYQNSFDPNDQLTNFVAGNDDSGPGSVITTNLTTGTDYYFVTTSFSPTDFGNFSTVITGAGTATCTDGLAVPAFNDNNFSYYPNPVKNILNLSYNQEISSVEVYNLLGQKVSSNFINANDANVDMSNLSKGAYMVRVTSNNQAKTIKVIKE
ncbi:T9SS type A sorting domain-containing protein [Flavobacterium paronense]|uniref:T9SS type A sorting domain-containing protein n=1 Tax=Flavobacterium paronense TaxID=1392775 RepID=A0ABV5GGM9_9FLAO|nr:T9SS type A sorting domain-containing protein [Flavobacterium paronense]MDN3675886.1 T9SS type A sorting domain-containing protein [Flavobacterium paronense]MDN3677158.1 T9SS type A sorting domain-containing protein [Flavobacterium paronense]